MSKLFTTYVRPTLEYGSQVWSPFLLKNIDLVENVQRYFSRCIPGLSTLSYPDRLAFLKLPSLELRRIRSDCIMLHKCCIIRFTFLLIISLHFVQWFLSAFCLEIMTLLYLSLWLILICINILLQYVLQIIGMLYQMILLVFHR